MFEYAIEKLEDEKKKNTQILNDKMEEKKELQQKIEKIDQYWSLKYKLYHVRCLTFTTIGYSVLFFSKGLFSMESLVGYLLIGFSILTQTIMERKTTKQIKQDFREFKEWKITNIEHEKEPLLTRIKQLEQEIQEEEELSIECTKKLNILNRALELLDTNPFFYQATTEEEYQNFLWQEEVTSTLLKNYLQEKINYQSIHLKEDSETLTVSKQLIKTKKI